MGIVRNKFINRIIDVIPARTVIGISDKIDQHQSIVLNSISTLQDETSRKLSSIQEKIDSLQEKSDHILDYLKISQEAVNDSRQRLSALRSTKKYESVYRTSSPLVTVRIATYNRSEMLFTKAIPSLLNQTYKNFEVIVVGDHCTDDTEERINSMKDARFRFYNLTARSIYPEDRIKKWQVIGALPMNTAVMMAQGDWIAPLDDDDEFLPDHIEVLLNEAIQSKAELVYGAMIQKNLVTGEELRIWSDQPRQAQVSLNGSIYMRLLADIFQYDQYSWTIGEPADWNMCRRMIESGVRIKPLDKDVGILNMIPAGHTKKDY